MPDDLGLLLYLPHRELENRVFAALAEAGFDDVTPAQARVFHRIDRDGSRLTELAEAARITKQTAGFLVDQLERAGYVERGPDPTDARARLIRWPGAGARRSRCAWPRWPRCTGSGPPTWVARGWRRCSTP